MSQKAQRFVGDMFLFLHIAYTSFVIVNNANSNDQQPENDSCGYHFITFLKVYLRFRFVVISFRRFSSGYDQSTLNLGVQNSRFGSGSQKHQFKVSVGV